FLGHRLPDRQQFVAIPHAELEAGWLAVGEFTHPGDEVDEFARRMEHLVGRWRDALLALRHAAGLRDLRGDLGRRQYAPDAGLGALAELQRHALDLVGGGLVAE